MTEISVKYTFAFLQICFFHLNYKNTLDLWSFTSTKFYLIQFSTERLKNENFWEGMGASPIEFWIF